MKKINLFNLIKSLDRRDFLKGGAIGTAALFVGTSCSSQGGTLSDSNNTTADGKTDDDKGDSHVSTNDAGADVRNADAVQEDGLLSDSFSPTCGEITEPNIEGPFFSPNSPEKKNLVEANMQGVRLRITGRVYDTKCQPIAGALLDFWQANHGGTYDNVGFTLRGHQFTNAEGRYELNTIIPGNYLNGATYRPGHIHVKAGGNGFKILTTQLYFDGDPYNSGDPWILPSLIMKMKNGSAGSKEAVFNFVLASV